MTVEEKRAEITRICSKSDCLKCPLHDLTKHESSCSGSELPDIIIERNYAILFPDNAKSSNESLEKAGEKILKMFGYETNPKNDPVNRPSHYTDGKIEVIEFIEDKNLGFCLGNAVKYIARAGKKDPTKEIEDLRKSIWYLERRIKEIEEARA